MKILFCVNTGDTITFQTDLSERSMVKAQRAALDPSPLSSTHHTTFAARLNTLLHPLPLSSAATVPLILVPNGSFLLFNKTQALSSKRTTRPSGRCSSFFVRTTTACRTSPRRILVAVEEEEVLSGMGRAFLITTTISSPVGDTARRGGGRGSVSWDCLRQAAVRELLLPQSLALA